MITYNKFKSKIYEQASLSTSFLYKDKRVTISDELNVSIDEQLIYYHTQINDLDEAIEVAKDWIDNIHVINTTPIISESKVVDIIKRHSDMKITESVVDNYIYFVESKLFSIDPVITEIKKRYNDSSFNKFEYELNDGSVVAIEEETLEKLSNYLEDKYNLVEHMRESKYNFMQVLKELEE